MAALGLLQSDRKLKKGLYSESVKQLTRMVLLDDVAVLLEGVPTEDVGLLSTQYSTPPGSG